MKVNENILDRTAREWQGMESEVKVYCRSFNVEFISASGGTLVGVDGRQYRDFLSGCGSLNYGHNHPVLKEALVEHILSDGLAMSMDLNTNTKRQFLETFERVILQPRGLDYVAQFPGPTGTNAVEAAIKLARKVTKRSGVIAFTNGFHGCTLGSLALTGSKHHRGEMSSLLGNVSRAAYENYFGSEISTIEMLDRMLSDPSGGIDPPAAVVVETVQGEGGLNVASGNWLRQLSDITAKHGALLVIDDIQAGCGRTGDFFSFEAFDIQPDIVTLAKSLSGFGLPMAILLFKRKHDVWMPGEHNGTFRGNNHAFVTARAALNHFWGSADFSVAIKRKARIVEDRLSELAEKHRLAVKGRGLMQGLQFKAPGEAHSVQESCFDHGLIIETCGPHNDVVKLLPPLTLSENDLSEGLDILAEAVGAIGRHNPLNMTATD